MNQNNGVFLLLIVCCWCWTIKSNAVVSKKRLQSYADQTETSKSALDCAQYMSDQDILNQIPFSIASDWITNENVYTMDETNTFVTYLRLGETDATVPESIFCLKNLEHLFIGNMNFLNGVVPDTLGNLQNLAVLIIFNTSITHMTDQLASLSNLRSLDLEYCSLSKLPNLSKLPYLYEFHVSHNQLSQINGLNNINRLYLDNNLFTEIPPVIEAEGLWYLSINSNPLKHVKKLSSFVNLQQLYLGNTTISSIPSSIDKLQNLMELDLSNNKLMYLPTNIFNLPELNLLSINDNLFSADEIESMKTKFSTLRPYMTLIV